MQVDNSLSPQAGSGGLVTPHVLQDLGDMLRGSLPSAANLKSNAPGFFPPGTRVVLHGLASRLDLQNAHGSVMGAVLNPDDDPRIPILIDQTGEQVKVRPSNLKPA
eukprot:9423317-Karenia_brevis.AAC.1